MFNIIMDVLEKYKAEVDNFNSAVFESDFEKVVDEIVERMDKEF